MTAKEALAELKSLGTEKMREYNIKHGATQNHFGVNLGQIRTLAKSIKQNHELAQELWETGNDEAKLLATLISKPKYWGAADLDRMVRDAGYWKVIDWLVTHVVSVSPDKAALREKWRDDKDELVGRAGWALTTSAIVKGEAIPLEPLLKTIHAEMATTAQHKQWSMNHCLAEIGIHHPELRERCIAIGEELGVLRDYKVPKGCISPFAPIWITEMSKRL